jgi:hypothetical protein
VNLDPERERALAVDLYNRVSTQAATSADRPTAVRTTAVRMTWVYS